MFDTHADAPLTVQGADDRTLVRVYAMEFWTEYKTEPDGTTQAVDWVKWAKPGSTPTIINEAIPRLSRPLTHSGPMGEVMYHPAWPSLRPQYEAWKRGETAELNGTSLDAWPALDKRQAKALKAIGLRTVEDVAALPDAQLGKVMLPNARALRTNAAHFLDARKNAAPVAAALAERDERLDALARENAELRGQLSEMMEMLKAQAAEKRGPGRPPKAD